MSPTAQEFVETAPISDVRKYVAEAVGTFVLVFAGVGTAVFAGERVGAFGVALAFGLTLAFLVYTIGPISGCHVNPAVTVGQLAIGRISVVTAGIYAAAQLVGGFLGGIAIFAIAKGLPSYDRKADGLGANGWGDHSPSFVAGNHGGYGIAAVIVVEVLLTGLLVFVVLASTDQISDIPQAGIAIGFSLVVIHLISIPIDNTSVNPARSLGVAPYQSGALAQVWVFVLFPLVGGALGALIYRGLYGRYERLHS